MQLRLSSSWCSIVNRCECNVCCRGWVKACSDWRFAWSVSDQVHLIGQKHEIIPVIAFLHWISWRICTLVSCTVPTLCRWYGILSTSLFKHVQPVEAQWFIPIRLIFTVITHIAATIALIRIAFVMCCSYVHVHQHSSIRVVFACDVVCLRTLSNWFEIGSGWLYSPTVVFTVL